MWSAFLDNAAARYCLDRRTSPCESRQHFDVQQYLAAAAVFCVLFCRKSVIRRRSEQTVFLRTVCETLINCVEFEWGPFLERITAVVCLSWRRRSCCSLGRLCVLVLVFLVPVIQCLEIRTVHVILVLRCFCVSSKRRSARQTVSVRCDEHENTRVFMWRKIEFSEFYLFINWCTSELSLKINIRIYIKIY